MAESKLELKPVRCGCGGEAFTHILGNEIAKGYYIACDECGTKTKVFGYEAEAVEAWNRAMSGSVQDCAENARCSERTAKVSKGAYDLMRCECGMPVSSNFDYCPKCRARLEWK